MRHKWPLTHTAMLSLQKEEWAGPMKEQETVCLRINNDGNYF